MNDQEKLITAYHEGGHAIAAASLRHTDPVTKITILPRGRALGYTMVLPSEDKYSTTRNELLDQLAYAMGGRVAEEIVFHDPTTGASNDIEKATNIARKMVTQYGMSARLGAVKLGDNDGDSPYTTSKGSPYGEQVAARIDEEVQALLENAMQEAWYVLTRNRDVLDNLAAELLEHETIGHERLEQIFAGIEKLPERPQWLSSPERPVSDRPPVALQPHLPVDEIGGETPHPGVHGGGQAVPQQRAARPRILPALEHLARPHDPGAPR